MSNNVTLIGNLVDDPELRFTPSGVAMAKIRLAVNRRYRDQAGEWQEDTSFFGGTLWRDAAENAAESLQKGMRVIVTGRLEQRTWETQEGEKRSHRRDRHRRDRSLAAVGDRHRHPLRPRGGQAASAAAAREHAGRPRSGRP